ncbi:MAG: trypsin-like peptidase domain-containing protein [Sulfitobacter litoralis]|mgnify:FL=1|jgi:S1-C subfamily serine protease|uniref:Peptidoglycan binding domain-containing protein n=1 Tax=Sulfitobacter litoralis TaxID=335975 RepID=A0ABY0S3S2_9RHOB|nr:MULTISPECIES: serine protease [Sulfitobacter]MBQ0717668.1 trypsin-like peptidase domain-containing protein [Sulfitobacter litoralis]MBQ0767300.1 trypsin-like peptidase domain-containing protein [Sulfitobacter litoralis]MBQ0802926.1 trypsin-like peptidase domain-containing protein [Sulfitobacter litoralis]MCF7725428.1 peptidoglycan-binding protein [Sulfitobacter sp. M22]MCF7776814.1 peptidoglycan-binding protein [Sulfitobacter sp. M220]|tara:strand:+ start:2302 stop:4131 length:1830 start_codon:yes stop_codon:yes gene_type:complete
MTRLFAALITALFIAPFAFAQSADDVVWIQVEAQPNLAAATERARAYSASLEDVNGFALGSGWYGIAVGPYVRDDAELLLRRYRQDGVIPRDSFIQLSDKFQQQFWPVGANVLNIPLISPIEPAAPNETQTDQEITQTTLPPAGEALDLEEALAAEAETTQVPVLPEPPKDETLSEARANERDLDSDAREQLQIALKWAGFYNAAIDGAFGRGTRGSMADWQEANGYDATGVLTTLQRAALLGQYNAVLEGLGLQTVRNTEAGIEMVMPTKVVTFDRFEPPFAHYNGTGDIDARVLLISQAGDQDTLFGLYDIMQTLEIVPEEGPRDRKSNSFELIGEDGRIVSQTQVSLENGEIKGFTLIWPAGDEDRRRRVITEMTKSFTRLSGTLDATAGSGDRQAVDLVSGLQIRSPKISRSGFFIDGRGTVATTSEAVQSCGRLTLDDETELEVLIDDTASGISLLKPRVALSPLDVAKFNTVPPRLQSEIAVAGFPYEGVLGSATVTYGTLADVRGLQGEENIARLALSARSGDAGGPILDSDGRVLGMLLPRADGARELPEDVAFAVEAKVIADLAQKAGVSVDTTVASTAIKPHDLREKAKGMTVLVSCWE